MPGRAWLGLGLAIMASAASAGPGPGSVWRQDYQQAMQEAASAQKPLLIHFGAPWCPPCRKVEAEVLYTRDVEGALAQGYVAFYADFDRHRELAEQFNVEKLPSDVIVHPQTGRVLQQTTGPHSLSSFMAMVTDVGRSFAAHSSAPATSNGSPALPLPVLGAPQSLVGLDGYSPVALGKNREWTRGNKQFTYDYKGISYHFNSDSEREEFKRAPDDYAPRLMGCDPVVLAETDRGVVGSTRFGAFFDDELYLFVSPESRARFKQSPERFSRLQHALRLDDIDTTAMR